MTDEARPWSRLRLLSSSFTALGVLWETALYPQTTPRFGRAVSPFYLER